MKIKLHFYGWLVVSIILGSFVIGGRSAFQAKWTGAVIIGGAIAISFLIILIVHKKHPNGSDHKGMWDFEHPKPDDDEGGS